MAFLHSVCGGTAKSAIGASHSWSKVSKELNKRKSYIRRTNTGSRELANVLPLMSKCRLRWCSTPWALTPMFLNQLRIHSGMWRTQDSTLTQQIRDRILRTQRQRALLLSFAGLPSRSNIAAKDNPLHFSSALRLLYPSLLSTRTRRTAHGKSLSSTTHPPRKMGQKPTSGTRVGSNP